MRRMKGITFHFSCNKTVTTAFGQYSVTCAAKNKSHVCEPVAYLSHNIYTDCFFSSLHIIRNILDKSRLRYIEYYFDIIIILNYNNYFATQ